MKSGSGRGKERAPEGSSSSCIWADPRKKDRVWSTLEDPGRCATDLVVKKRPNRGNMNEAEGLEGPILATTLGDLGGPTRPARGGPLLRETKRVKKYGKRGSRASPDIKTRRADHLT